jgi:putative ABC transport system permease protein
VGDVFRIVDQEFHVRGVLQSTGDVRTEGAILVSLETLWHLSGKTDAVSLAWVKAQAQQDVEALAVDLEQTPAVISGSYTVQTSKRLSEIVQTVMRLLKATLLGIAAVALLVGGIGLMNTMFMAVLERTREIGILASLGAHSRQILALILWESGLLGLLGGMIGVLLGVGLSMSVAAVIAQAVGVPPFAPVVRVCLVVGSLLFSLGLGMVAGILPARRAARLRPVEALRHE